MARGSVNKVMLIGTLGRDPEMRYLPNGNAVVSISLATDEGYKDKNNGQQVDRTEWHRVEAFGRLAEIIGEYLKKGAKCYVEGKLKTDEYEKDGIKRYSTKIVANEMTMLDSRQGADGQGGYNNQGAHPGQNLPKPGAAYNSATAQPVANPRPPAGNGYAAAQSQAPSPSNSFDDFDDDIPF